MRRILPTLFVYLCLSSLPMAEAAQSTDSGPVAQAVQQLHEALLKRDQKRLSELTAAQLTYGHSTGGVEDRATFIDNVAAGKTSFARIDFDESVISVTRDVAWVRGSMRAEMNSAGGGTAQVAFKILYVFIKERGAWKLLVRQSVIQR